MAIIEEKFLLTGGLIDASMDIVESISDLKTVQNKFIGMTKQITNVINGKSYPLEALLVDGKNSYNWQLRCDLLLPTYQDLLTFTSNVMSELSVTSRGKTTYSCFFTVGMEATVIADETSEGKSQKYCVTSVVNDVITWEAVSSGSGDGKPDASQTPAEVIGRINAGKTGSIVYPEDTLYSYLSGDTVIYTTDKSEAEGQEGYTEYPESLYVITTDDDGNVILSTLITQNASSELNIKIIGDDI